jgi:hypothetical protein
MPLTSASSICGEHQTAVRATVRPAVAQKSAAQSHTVRCVTRGRAIAALSFIKSSDAKTIRLHGAIKLKGLGSAWESGRLHIPSR